ncbi:hypothetical protein [uncultured Lacinutrix sp.]|uniref:hypothetical protein n=1 Tax=uncultured Lacinutrix sp. TaxID=574032 RepID=UPI00260BCC82|nr:hypothetical protein [uncultured Lacinutrix sp.]
MKNLKLILLLLIIISSCQRRTEFPDISKEIDFAYKQLKYSDKVSDKNLKGIRFFSNDSLLIETIGFDYRYKLVYDSNNKLLEEYGCRMYNCDIGSRKLYFYDDKNNLIGNFHTSDSIVNKDAIDFKQTIFYNSKNQLIKELIQSGNNVKGEYFETWKEYEYLNNRILKEIETNNSDTIWIAKYEYNPDNKLIRIERKLGHKYEIETFEYNKLNRIKKHTIKSNEHKIEKHTSYSANNNSTEYNYYENGLIKEKIHFNHLGEERWTNIYEYITKSTKYNNGNK